VATTNDPFALDSAERIVLDGANGINGAPRQHFPDGGLFSLVSVVVVVLTVGALKRRFASLVPLLLALAALPGLVGLLVLRADAPASRGALAARVSQTLGQLEAQAPWPQTPVHVGYEDDDVLFPLGRYAWPSRPEGASGAVELELRGDSLDVVCRVDEASRRHVCEARP
jgi:hypothetical protein